MTDTPASEIQATEVLNVLFGFTTFVWLNDLFGGPRGDTPVSSMMVNGILVALYAFVIFFWSSVPHPEGTAARLRAGDVEAKKDLLAWAASLAIVLLLVGYTYVRFRQYILSSVIIAGFTVVWLLAASLIDRRERVLARAAGDNYD